MLKPDRYVLVATPKWKGRKTADIIKSERIIDFYESDKTTYKYLSHYGLEGMARKDRLFVNTNYAIISLFKAGIGYGTLTMEVAASSVERGELIILNQKQVYEDKQALAWYPRDNMPSYFKEIIGSIH
jgi:DNA-binding transcriptional LysR family regulator